MATLAETHGRKVFRFLWVGAVATAAHYAVLITLVEVFGMNATIGAAIGFTVGALVSYAANYVFTFTSTLPHRIAAPRFAVSAGCGVLINSAIMAALAGGLGIHYLVAQAVATAATLLWNYVTGYYWSFRAAGPIASRSTTPTER
jgi:putative flippase GtrA